MVVAFEYPVFGSPPCIQVLYLFSRFSIFHNLSGLANFVKNVFACPDVSMDSATKVWSAFASLVGMECFVINVSLYNFEAI